MDRRPATRARLAEPAPLTILDVHGADEFIGPHSHIPGALNIPHDELQQRLEEVAASLTGEVIMVDPVWLASRMQGLALVPSEK